MQKFAIAAVALTMLTTMLVGTVYSTSAGAVLARAEGYSVTAMPISDDAATQWALNRAQDHDSTP
jgi:hypothetical protein